MADQQEILSGLAEIVNEVAGVPVYIVHLSSSDALEEVKRARDRGVHAFAETWATLTASRGEPRIERTVASRVGGRPARHVKPFALRWEDYRAALERCDDGRLRSGALYDALHLLGAARQSADVFLTFNTRHFSALVREDAPRIVAPPDPPALLGG